MVQFDFPFRGINTVASFFADIYNKNGYHELILSTEPGNQALFLIPSDFSVSNEVSKTDYLYFCDSFNISYNPYYRFKPRFFWKHFNNLTPTDVSNSRYSFAGEPLYLYRRKQSFMSQSERNFYSVLLPVVSSFDLVLFSMVRLADIIEVCIENDTLAANHFLWKIANKHVDFLICSVNLEPKLVVELDDHYHKRADRSERDEFVDACLRNAGIPVCRFDVEMPESFDEDAVRTIIAEHLQLDS
jgi:very-short-patch-repair endonuclease